MSGLVESATAVMQMAERRLGVVAGNVANISTPGYKRRVGFAAVMIDNAPNSIPSVAVRHVVDQGKLEPSGNPLDFAIAGEGFFRVRASEDHLWTRQGQFSRDAEGLLVTPQGYILQQAGGGDLAIDGETVRVDPDGTVIDQGRPIGRIAIERPASDADLVLVSDTFFAAAEPADEGDRGTVRQAMVESSNVELGDQMIESMAALRQAESGARLIQLYDELMGRVVSAFGAGGR